MSASRVQRSVRLSNESYNNFTFYGYIQKISNSVILGKITVLKTKSSNQVPMYDRSIFNTVTRYLRPTLISLDFLV